MCAIVLWLMAACAWAQATDQPAKSDGRLAPPVRPARPDLNGVWQVMNSANFDLEAHAARAAMAMRTGPHGPLPLKEVIALGFTRPWKITMNLYRRVGTDAQLQQFKCIEFVEELIYGHLRKEPLK